MYLHFICKFNLNIYIRLFVLKFRSQRKIQVTINLKTYLVVCFEKISHLCHKL